MSGTSKSGRKRKPRELKVLEGSFRKDRDANTPAVVGGFPLPPAGLSQEELVLWQSLPKVAWVGESDTIAIWGLVDLFARFLAHKRMERETGETNDEKAMKLWGAVLTWLRENAFTPTTRAKMTVPKVDDSAEDKWGGIL